MCIRTFSSVGNHERILVINSSSFSFTPPSFPGRFYTAKKPTMLRSQLNEKETFSATLTASAAETEAALKQRRTEMDQAWDSVDERWKELEQRMVEVGIARPSSSSEGMVRMNVGGSHVNCRRSVLEGKRGSCSQAWSLGNLFEAQWDERVPRDADGRIVLDESPVCAKHLVHALLTGNHDFGAGLIAEEKPYLLYVARALGLSPVGMSVEGGSTILRPGAEGPLTAALQSWCPDKPGGLQLLYRASRDGWTPAAFHAKCDSSSSTVTMFQVGSGEGASIAGGYSSVSWAPSQQERVQYQRGYTSAVPSCSPGAFIFMLRDGTVGGAKREFQPVKWGIKSGQDGLAVYKSCHSLPTFGSDLIATVNGTTAGNLTTSGNTYAISSGSAILKLNGRALSEIEVFSLRFKASALPQPKATPASSFLPEGTNRPTLQAQSKDDFRTFGVFIAGSLMEERVALQEAEAELSRASARTVTCAASLAAVYGPDIAAGKEDSVVELNVRGTRMTTLRSTMQMCPDSALAARFDDEKWPATEKDLDEHGRRKIDCSPSVFSKVLDVLRMKKRWGWVGDGSKKSGAEVIRVAVKAPDRASFEEFVHMYFPGCESFLTDHVEFLEESKDTA